MEEKNKHRILTFWLLIVVFICRYLRGRISYDQINAVVQEMNKAVVCKYKILYQPLKSMSAQVKSLYYRFIEQETKDTKGIFVFLC